MLGQVRSGQVTIGSMLRRSRPSNRVIWNSPLRASSNTNSISTCHAVRRGQNGSMSSRGSQSVSQRTCEPWTTNRGLPSSASWRYPGSRSESSPCMRRTAAGETAPLQERDRSRSRAEVVVIVLESESYRSWSRSRSARPPECLYSTARCTAGCPVGATRLTRAMQ